MILRLRLLEGVDCKKAFLKFGIDVIKKFEKEINRMIQNGLLEIVESTKNTQCIKLTKKGLDFANIVWKEFI